MVDKVREVCGGIAIITCKFTYNPDFMPLYWLGLTFCSIFIFIPYSIYTLRFLFFRKCTGGRTPFEIVAQPLISIYKWRVSELAAKRAGKNKGWTIAGFTSRFGNDTKVHPIDTLEAGNTPSFLLEGTPLKSVAMMMSERGGTKRSDSSFSGGLFQRIATTKTFQPEKSVFRTKKRTITTMIGGNLLAAPTNVKKQSPAFLRFRKASMMLGREMFLSRVDEK